MCAHFGKGNDIISIIGQSPETDVSPGRGAEDQDLGIDTECQGLESDIEGQNPGKGEEGIGCQGPESGSEGQNPRKGVGEYPEKGIRCRDPEIGVKGQDLEMGIVGQVLKNDIHTVDHL